MNWLNELAGFFLAMLVVLFVIAQIRYGNGFTWLATKFSLPNVPAKTS